MNAPSRLEVRRRPIQRRGQERVARILEVATALLAEVGAERLTTRAIAERAGVPIGSIYQYFPNKQAIFAALLERVTAHARARVSEVLEADEGAVESWGRLVDQAVDAYTEAYALEPGYPALLSALRSTPELYAISQRGNEEAIQVVIGRLRRTDPVLPDARLADVARTTLDVVNALLDRALATPDPERAQATLRELKRLVKGYLATYFGEPRVGFGD